MRRDLPNSSVIPDTEVFRYLKLLVIVNTDFSYLIQFSSQNFIDFTVSLRQMKYYPLLLEKIPFFFSYNHWIKSEGIVMNSSFHCPGSENMSHNNFLMDNFLDINAGFSK